MGIAASTKAKDGKADVDNSCESVNEELKTVDKLTRHNIEIVRAGLEMPTPRGRSGKKAALLM